MSAAAVAAMTIAFAHFANLIMLVLCCIDGCSLEILPEVPTEFSAVNLKIRSAIKSYKVSRDGWVDVCVRVVGSI
jgi:hypothetical protein